MNYFSELFSDDNGVCHQTFLISSARGKALFGDIDDNEKAVIDGYFEFSIGNKLLTPAVKHIIEESETPAAAREKLTKYFLIKNEVSLLAVKSTLAITVNPLVNNTTTKDRTLNASGSNTNKIAGYDSAEMVDSDGNNTTNATAEHVTESTNNTGKSSQYLVNEKLKADKENVYISIVLDAVKDFFTLDLYD